MLLNGNLISKYKNCYSRGDLRCERSREQTDLFLIRGRCWPKAAEETSKKTEPSSKCVMKYLVCKIPLNLRNFQRMQREFFVRGIGKHAEINLNNKIKRKTFLIDVMRRHYNSCRHSSRIYLDNRLFLFILNYNFQFSQGSASSVLSLSVLRLPSTHCVYEQAPSRKFF